MSALYIHTPFCRQKCNYCDFTSYAGKEHLIDDYITALCRELEFELSSGEWHLATGDQRLETIYFGGGTPTLLEPKHFEKILSTGNLSSASEISVEANPGTADYEKLKALRRLGINRLSIGVQSFHDHHLESLGRIHDSGHAEGFIRDARAAGFDNLSLDLIFGLPHQTLEEWKNDLIKAIAHEPHHLSAYNLEIEEGTPFHLQHQQKKLPLPGEETELAMYEHAIQVLWVSGYEHYEISNFSRPGYHCKHNINYWKNGNYLGVGAGAHSHVRGKRWANPDTIEEYIKSGKRRLETGDHKRETIFMGLRLLEGLDEKNFAGFEKEVTELTKDGLLTKEGSNIKLTRRGLHLANNVFERFV